ncbi:ABC transporter transmembrane region 2 family [Synechococcus sp. PCC 7335]|uniref:ABC transporter ATP-binding protein/permease n=1 Tax=Synechococcus sp. (strain ATCC 29403 / PCC 7335) TaxID=91464 RepID=UPI00017EC414|nr:ABC transporter ATP-binding protein/permease [Synechococcus sp. PCC 7335]EDX86984.1 ABC transporter transmembrane region 2 family [Synechococcus sp. PCC 7335]
MERFNFKVFRRFWAIARPYWIGDEKWKARGLLLLIVVLLLGYTGLSVVLNNQRGELISALSAKSESRFWTTVGIFIGVLVVYAPLLAGYTYLRDRLGLEWRRWLTDNFVERYFAKRSFYQINQFNPEIDNPDQRIAEDVKSFTQESLTLALVVTDSVLEVIAFSGVLWGISRELVLFLVAYAVVGTVLTVGIFGQPLVKLNFEQLKKEANFRFSLVRVRENAEAIAFYQGEEQESNQIKERFLAAFNNYKSLLIWELSLNGLTNFYEFIPFVLPAIVVAPGVFSGELEVGKVSEAQGAFIRVFFSFNVIVARLQSLTAFGAGIDRLYEFSEAIGYDTTEAGDKTAVVEEVVETKAMNEGSGERAESEIESKTASKADDQNSQPVISFKTARELALQSLTLQTPNYQRTLIEDLSLAVEAQSSLLVMGPSGCGKSSLMRAIAGLWTSGEGTITRPKLEDLLFLPQKPYMILGSLRQQLLYPYPEADIRDVQLTEVLQRVNLPNLEAQFGLQAEAEWSDVLSLGEQQRLSFARVLIHLPKYVILDEATSALDTANEEQLYDQLAKTKAAYLSVGHRASLKHYHQSLLRLAEDHSWQLLDLETEP